MVIAFIIIATNQKIDQISREIVECINVKCQIDCELITEDVRKISQFLIG